MKELSIDLETAGTLVDSQILSIGLAMFDLKTGAIGATLYLPIILDNDEPINATIGTIKFWVGQAQQNPEALAGLLDSYEPNAKSVPMLKALRMITTFVNNHKPKGIWANGTKFDIGMLEYQFHQHSQPVPWFHNTDRCMRTLKKFAGNIDIEDCGAAHNALADAIWQAKYISAACNKLCLV
jgi:hypothetical protein